MNKSVTSKPVSNPKKPAKKVSKAKKLPTFRRWWEQQHEKDIKNGVENGFKLTDEERIGKRIKEAIFEGFLDFARKNPALAIAHDLDKIKPSNITRVDVDIQPDPKTPEEELVILRKKYASACEELTKHNEWFDTMGGRDDIESLLSIVTELVDKQLYPPVEIPGVQKIIDFAKGRNVLKSDRALIQARVDFFFEPCNPPGVSNEVMASRIVEKMKYGNNSDFAYRIGTPVIIGKTREVTKVEVLS